MSTMSASMDVSSVSSYCGKVILHYYLSCHIVLFFVPVTTQMLWCVHCIEDTFLYGEIQNHLPADQQLLSHSRERLRRLDTEPEGHRGRTVPGLWTNA